MYCALCDGSTHFPRQCVEYVTVEQRSERADELDLCLRCLRGPRGHACTDFCYICKGDHEKALCTVHDSSKHARPCVFCHGQHWDCHCPQYKTVEERIAQAEKVDVCTRCLTVRHPRNERCHLVDRVCYYCQSNDHNKALCPEEFGSNQGRVRRSRRSGSRSSKRSRSSSSSSRSSRSRSRSRRRAPSRGRSFGRRRSRSPPSRRPLVFKNGSEVSGERRTPASFSPSRRRSPDRTRRFGWSPAREQYCKSPARRQNSKSPARRRSSHSPQQNGQNHRRFVPRNGRPTCKCVFCGDWHWNEACTVIRSAEEREKFLKDGGHCLRCTRLGHRTENCYSKGVHRPCCGCGSTSHITPLCSQQFPSDKQSTSASASFEDAPRTFGEMVARRQSERQSADERSERARRESPTRASPSTRRSPVSTRNSAWKPYQPPTAPQGVENPTVSSTEKATKESPAAVVASVPPSPVPDDEHLFGFRSSIGFASPTNAIVPTWPSTSSDRPYRDNASSDDIEVLNEVQRERKPGEKEKERKKHDEEKRERRKKSKSRESDEKRSKKKKKKKERENSTERGELEEIKAQLAKEKNELVTLRTSLEATERGVQEREAQVSQRERQAQQKEETSKAENARLAEERQKLEDEKKALKDAQVALEEQRKELEPETLNSKAQGMRAIKQEVMDAQEQENASEQLKKREAALDLREKKLKQREAKVKADEEKVTENTAELDKVMQGLEAQKKRLDAEQKALDEKRRMAAAPTTSHAVFDPNLELEEAGVKIRLLQKEVAELKRQLENAKTDVASLTKGRDEANESILEQIEKRREMQERAHRVEADLFRARAENEAHVLSLKFRDEVAQVSEQETPQPTPTGMRTVKQELCDSTEMSLASEAAAGHPPRASARKRSMQPSPDSSTSPKRPRKQWDEAAIAVLKEKLDALVGDYASENAKFTCIKYGAFAVENVGRVSRQTERLAEFLKRTEPTNATIADRIHQLVQET